MLTPRSMIPPKALSVKQPWAWAIVWAGKHLENRAWQAMNPNRKFRGSFAVHASSGMTRQEYQEAADFMKKYGGIICPPPHDLLRGGIIGTAKVVDWIGRKDTTSFWFTGPRALRLTDMQPCWFIPCSGQLGFFDWKESGDGALPPAKWMLPKKLKQVDLPLPDPGKQRVLL